MEQKNIFASLSEQTASKKVNRGIERVTPQTTAWRGGVPQALRTANWGSRTRNRDGPG